MDGCIEKGSGQKSFPKLFGLRRPHLFDMGWDKDFKGLRVPEEVGKGVEPVVENRQNLYYKHVFWLAQRNIDRQEGNIASLDQVQNSNHGGPPCRITKNEANNGVLGRHHKGDDCNKGVNDGEC